MGYNSLVGKKKEKHIIMTVNHGARQGNITYLKDCLVVGEF